MIPQFMDESKVFSFNILVSTNPSTIWEKSSASHARMLTDYSMSAPPSKKEINTILSDNSFPYSQQYVYDCDQFRLINYQFDIICWNKINLWSRNQFLLFQIQIQAWNIPEFWSYKSYGRELHCIPND